MVSQEKQFWDEVIVWREMTKLGNEIYDLREQGKTKEETKALDKKFGELLKKCNFPSSYPTNCCRFCGRRDDEIRDDEIGCCVACINWINFCIFTARRI